MVEPALTGMELAVFALDAQFTHDAHGRIVAVNEPDGEPEPAPRFFLTRTRDGIAWRVRYDVPEPIVKRLVELVASEPVTTDLVSPPVHLDAMLDALHQDREAVIGFQGPAYRFPVTMALPVTGEVTRISRGNLQLLRRVVPDLDALDRDFDVVEPWMAVVQDGVAVATCYSCRISERVAQARVDTAPPFRGRGYAPAMVAAWAREVRATGRVPLYGTTWDNLASQAVARKLGLALFGVSLALV